MKGRTVRKRRFAGLATHLVTVSMALLAATALAPAHAEHVQGQTPFFAGVPLESLASGAPAQSINSTRLVWGTCLSVDALSLGSAGQLNIRLTDIEWPEALQSLDLLVTDLDGLWQKLDRSGSLTIDLTGPARLFVAVFARSDGKNSPGLYHLTANFSPVPLPAALWLLMSGVGALGLFRRRRTVTT